jgi:hemerythrin superfamily protein
MDNIADIFDRLRADHAGHRKLLSRIAEIKTDTAERRELFEDFTREAKGHAAAEEQALYSTVMRKPDLTSDARHSVSEHKEIEDLLNDVAATEPVDEEWIEAFAELRHTYLHHIEEEESEMFPHFAAQLSEEDAVWMKTVFDRRKVAEKDKAEVTPEKLEDAKQ